MLRRTRSIFVDFENESFVKVRLTSARCRLRGKALATEMNVNGKGRIRVIIIQMLQKCSATADVQQHVPSCWINVRYSIRNQHECDKHYIQHYRCLFGPPVTPTSQALKDYNLPASHMFQPLALETLGLINSSSVSFLVELGRRLSDVSGDARETMYLFQPSFSGGPALQFCSLQRNLYSSYRIGLAPLQQTWF